MKKNLVFFRGCGATFEEVDRNSATIIGEGKTSQLLRFLEWCTELKSEAALTKANFQSPRHDVTITAVEWLPFEGNIKGFQSKSPAPGLGEGATSSEQYEVSNMAGTDESV